MAVEISAITSHVLKWSINPISNPSPVDSHTASLYYTYYHLQKGYHIQWIPVNWDKSGLEYFVPIKRLPQIYEVAYKGLRRYMYIYIFPRVLVTREGVWFDDSIYGPLIHSRLVTTLHRTLTHRE
jgi:hypothetical protein